MYLGIDLGTSEVKLLLLSEAGKVIATHGERLDISRPQPHWSEQSPDDWWVATCSGVEALAAGHPESFREIRAIGLSGQMHGAVLLDQDDNVLRPAILWNDTRSSAECTQMMERMPSLTAIAGNLAMPGFTAPKVLWVKNHEPRVFERIAKVLLPKDYLRLKMTGEYVSEMSDAAGTLWLDVAKRDWSDELLALTGLTRTQMPRLVEGSQVSAPLSSGTAQKWGLSGDVIVAGGAGDNAASAVGIGAVKPGDGFVSLGTSGVMFVVTDRFRPNPESAVHAFCHALPKRWHQMTVMLSAASCLRWVTHLVGAQNEQSLLDQVGAMSQAQQMNAPIFLPYLGGERTPHNDVFARGVFYGLDHETDAEALGYAVLEGVAFGMADGLAALKGAGTEIAGLGLVGGGSRSPLWAQLHSNVLGLPVRVLAGAEAGGALGAARLAWLADGGSEEQVCVAPETVSSFEPDPKVTAALMERYEQFKETYKALRPVFRSRHMNQD